MSADGSPKFRTFKKWKKKGYRILDGSKATWIDGKPKFSADQVTKAPWPTAVNRDWWRDPDTDCDEPDTGDLSDYH